VTQAVAWAGLTAAQHQAWIDFAIAHPGKNRFGDPMTLSGASMFQRINNNLAQAGLPQLSDPPPDTNPNSLDTFSVTIAVAPLAMNAVFTPTPTPADVIYLIRSTMPIPHGRRYARNLFRDIQKFAALAASPANFDAAYVATFGDPTGSSGAVIISELRAINTKGAVSVPLRTTTTIP
jgi:hypothetical protein